MFFVFDIEIFTNNKFADAIEFYFSPILLNLDEIKIKYCTKCIKNKNINEFGLDNYSKDKLTNWCAQCRRDHLKKRRENNKEINETKDPYEDPTKLKKCPRCPIPKTVINFGIRMMADDGLNTYCIDCYRIIDKENREKNTIKNTSDGYIPISSKECSNCTTFFPASEFTQNLAKSDRHNSLCSKCRGEKSEDFKINNPESVAASRKYQKEWRKNNPEKVKASKNKHIRKKKKEDLCFKFRHSVSNSIRDVLKINGGNKGNKSCWDFLPYTPQELKDHLEKQFEPWMNFENHGAYNHKKWDDNDQTTWKWNLDHINPHINFPYSSLTDENFQKAWALSNLRPLSAKQNVFEAHNRTPDQIASAQLSQQQILSSASQTLDIEPLNKPDDDKQQPSKEKLITTP